MTEAVEIKNPMFGAAYNLLYARFQPHMCFDRLRQAEILSEYVKIGEWAKTQDATTRRAYTWAIELLTKQMERQVGGNEMGNRVLVAQQTIPKPPILQAAPEPERAVEIVDGEILSDPPQ